MNEIERNAVEQEVKMYQKFVGLCSGLLIIIPIVGIVFACINFAISFISDNTTASVLNAVGHFFENIYSYFLWMIVGGIGLYSIRYHKRKLARFYAFALTMASLYMIGRIVPYSFNNAIHSSGVGIYIVPIISLISSVLSFCLCLSCGYCGFKYSIGLDTLEEDKVYQNLNSV